jgi:hypothetical protein
MVRRDIIEERFSQLISDFGSYVEAYDERVPFSTDQLATHRATIALRQGRTQEVCAETVFLSPLEKYASTDTQPRAVASMLPKA